MVLHGVSSVTAVALLLVVWVVNSMSLMIWLLLLSVDNGTSAALSVTSAVTGLDPRAASLFVRASRNVLLRVGLLVDLCSWQFVNDVRVSVLRLLGCVEERHISSENVYFGRLSKPLRLEPEHLMLYEFTT
jgi:hypothetical protein